MIATDINNVINNENSNRCLLCPSFTQHLLSWCTYNYIYLYSTYWWRLSKVETFILVLNYYSHIEKL